MKQCDIDVAEYAKWLQEYIFIYLYIISSFHIVQIKNAII
jgi:hypothetical protein